MHRLNLPQSALLSAAASAPMPRRHVLRAVAAATVLAGTAPLAWAASPPQRVVCIGGALTEMVYALGMESALVGVDSTSLHPAAATRLPGVGYARTLSSEGILALAPTLVVATEEAGPPAVLRHLASAGVTVQVLPAHHRFDGVLERITRLGELMDRRAQAAQLVQRLRADWQAARAPIVARKGTAPKVLFILSPTPSQIMVGGQGSAAEAMLAYAGAVNAAQSFQGFKPLTPEAVVAAQPDVVLLTQQGLETVGGIDGALRLPGLSQTPAGRHRRVVAHEALFMLGFGPRIAQALTALDNSLQQAMKAST